MSFLTQVTALPNDPKNLDNLDNLSSSGGPNATPSDPEIEFEKDGRAVIRELDKVAPKKLILDFKKGVGDRDEGSNSSLPSNPNGPIDFLTIKNPLGQPREGEVAKSSFLVKASMLVIAKNVFFKDVLATTKSLYPDIKLTLLKPATYVWNPGTPAPAPVKDDKDDKDAETTDDAEVPDDAAKETKIDIQGIKNRISMKFPDMKWAARVSDGCLAAQLSFQDGSYAEFAIGANANHLTLIYNLK